MSAIILQPIAFSDISEGKGRHHIYLGSVAQWLRRRTYDAGVAGSIPTTAHVVIALGKQFILVHPSAKWVPGHWQLRCIDY